MRQNFHSPAGFASESLDRKISFALLGVGGKGIGGGWQSLWHSFVALVLSDKPQGSDWRDNRIAVMNC